MKKILLGIAFAVSCLSVSAQQVNGGFDANWADCQPYTGGKTTTVGTSPQGWNSANVAGYNMSFLGWMGKTTVVTEGTGRTGKSVVLANTPNSIVKSQIVPGYIALGTPWNTANTSGGDADGGCFGGLDFTYKPDAVRFYYKREATAEENFSMVIAYLWKGSWSQESVPVSIGSSPTKVTMVDRDRNILDVSTAKGGEITNNGGVCIASLNQTITNITNEWTEMVVPLTYHDTEAAPEKLNIIFSSTDYFNTNVPSGTKFTIDDVDLVYYSTLSALSYEGAGIEFEEKTLNYDLSDVDYEESKLAFTVKGVAAKASRAYDEENALLTITVTNEGNANAEDNTTVYTVQFKKPQSQEVTVYSNNLMVTMRNDASEPYATIDNGNTDIQLIKYLSPESYSFLLKDFNLGGAMPVGDIQVDNLKRTEVDTKSVQFTGEQDLALMGGAITAHVIVSATVTGENMVAHIEIPGIFTDPIRVDFAPALTVAPDATVGEISGTYNVTLLRTFKAGWNTLCLPFNMSLESFTGLNEEQTVVALNPGLQTFSNTANGVLNFVSAESIEANKPYIIYFEQATTLPFSLPGTEVKATTPVEITSGDFTFKGNYEAGMNLKGKYSIMVDTEGLHYIALGKEGAVLESTAAYFTAGSEVEADGMRVLLEGEKLQPEVTVYSNNLMVTMRNDASEPYATIDNGSTEIQLIKHLSPESYSFLLKDFNLGGFMPLGDIQVDNLNRTEAGTKSVQFTGEQDLVLMDGALTAHVIVSATVTGENLVAHIEIPGIFADPIRVDFAPALMIAPDATVNEVSGTYNVTLLRTFKAGWNTLCLPFDMSLESFTGLNEEQTVVALNPKLQTFSDASNNVLNFKTATSIEANKPYLIYFDAETVLPFLLSGTAVNVGVPAETAITSGEFKFMGNYVAGMDMEGKYGVATGEDDFQRIMLGGAGSTLMSTGAFFTATGAKANGMLIQLEGGKDVTSIDGVTVVGGNAAIYNLQGVKVGHGSTEGLPQGVYVTNGKKVIVK